GYTTDFVYNTMGRLTQKQSPLVSYTAENGAVSTARPVEQFYYDAAGRMVGKRDANGNLTTRALLGGTGHDGSEGLVTYEYHADGGYLRNAYDQFGDLRISWDEISRRTDMSYDAMGRLTQVTKPNGLVENFGYDMLGQRISHWDNVRQNPIYGPPEQVWVEDPPYWDPYYGWIYPGGHWETQTPIIGYEPEKEITDYDLQGRVTRQVAFGGDTTTVSYAWSGGIATGGMGTFGGWTQTTTMANGRTATEQADVFGHQVYKSDLGGHVSSFTYDLAGRLIRSTGGETVNYVWLNTGKLAQSFTFTGDYASMNWTRKGTSYGYDKTGNLVSERLTDEGETYYEYWDPYYGNQTYHDSWSRTYKDATASFDAAGRMVSWAEAGGVYLPNASTSYEYDLTGNIRRANASYRPLDQQGAQAAYMLTQDNWYRYDSMNRMVTRGSLVGGQIVRGYGGADHLYDTAGQRVSTTLTTQGQAYVYDPYYNPYGGGNPYELEYAEVERAEPWGGGGDPYILVYYDQQTREDYNYDAGGALTAVRIAQGGYVDNGDGTVTPEAPPAYAALRASFTYDLLGRQTHQVDWLGDGTSAAYDRTSSYNSKGQVFSETTINRQGSDTITSYTSHDFGYGASYALGSVVSTSTSTYKNNAYQSNSTTTTSYVWFDGAAQSQISHRPNTSQSTVYNTAFNYDASGVLSSISVNDGRPRTVSFINDANGQAIKRDESDYAWNNGDPHEAWHRFGGKQIGMVGNNGTLDTDYGTSIANRTRAPGTGAFRFGSGSASMTANFDLSNEAISSYSQGLATTSYTVRGGETLETIAANLWGDSSLWYKIAEANGLTAANGLVEDQRLTIPVGVMKSHHNASTFKPFDPAEALGDVSPTTPQPQSTTVKKNKCGIFGAILLVVIAVAVTVITAGAAAAALSPAISGLSAGIGAVAAGTTGLSAGALIGIGVASAAAGSIASQGFGVATGIQDKFSWKAVALAAIGGGVGAGFAASGIFSGIGNNVLRAAVSGAASSALTQGIGVATGLQDKFDWAGVAAAGIGAAASTAVAGRLGNMNPYAADLVTGAAGAIAGAAARSLIEGTSFGDNLLAALPDVIGSTLGNLLSERIAEALEARAPVPTSIDGITIAAADGPYTAEAQQAAAAVAPPPAITAAELKEWQTNNLWDVENIRLDKDNKELAKRQAKETQNVAKETTKRDAVQQQVNAAIAANKPAKDIANLQKKLLSANGKVTKVQAKEAANVAKQQAVIATTQALITRLKATQVKAFTIVRSQKVTINERVTVNGTTTTNTYQYTIQGTGFQFATAREAALDGIALGFAVRKVLGDNWERGGMVYSAGNGFVRGPILLGTKATPGYSTLTPGRNYVPGTGTAPNVVGIFHIHPTGNPRDVDFSNPGDVTSFVTTNTGITQQHPPGAPLTFWLGGADGSFDTLTWTAGGNHNQNDTGYRNFFGTR
ncbi:MAG: trimeric autotransporter adhesin, partial [Sphingomonadales bacterium]|nr:trimeric autotransporter adhesin [Sphingomonadales bacterium]